jgi:hypothetical protein
MSNTKRQRWEVLSTTTRKVLLAVALFATGSAQVLAQTNSDQEFYAKAGDEYIVEFRAEVRGDFNSVEQIKELSQARRIEFIETTLKPTIKFLFGPMTHRQWGGEQKGYSVDVEWDNAELRNGAVFIPYSYRGQWLINKNVAQKKIFDLPLPYNLNSLRTPEWLQCTDSDPEHATWSFFWYFWDPSRSGCDHKEYKHYQTIKPVIVEKTTQTIASYPEYENMLSDGVITMTFGLGYVEDPADPKPFEDADYGMYEFRRLISWVKSYAGPQAVELPILQSEYPGYTKVPNRIGTRFQFERNGVNFDIKIVSSGRVDQMELFAKSFAADHDDYFGWFGHSRVGSGFDAGQFNMMLRTRPNVYSISRNYQMIYWAGCNSYSYYTKPFFDFKVDLKENDPQGTKKLDIISNALPSFFSLNARNAMVLVRALTNPLAPMSYQRIIDEIETQSNMMGIDVLVNVLGDEDNE